MRNEQKARNAVKFVKRKMNNVSKIATVITEGYGCLAVKHFLLHNVKFSKTPLSHVCVVCKVNVTCIITISVNQNELIHQ